MKATDNRWCVEAHRILKAELARRDISYQDLTKKLAMIGIQETVPGIRGKMHRGTFSFSWLLQCMEALEIMHINIDLKPLYDHKGDDLNNR